MPKEAKKFINPLLRSSQPLEARQDPAVEPEEGPSSARKSSELSVAVMPEISLARSTSVRTEVSPVVVSLPDQVDVPVTSAIADVTEELTDHQPVTLPSTSTRKIKNTRDDRVRHLVSPSVPPSSTLESAVVENSEPVAGSLSSYETVPVVEKTEVTTSTSTSTSTLNETIRHQPQSTYGLAEEADAPIADMDTKEADFLTTRHKPIAGRRKRRELSFEKTHERITVWVDKQLKQAFEELAYQRELPKTTLLNEAIADLLRKYNID